MELALEVIAAEELRRTVGRFRPAARNQIEGSGKRIARRVAHFYPLGIRGAAACKRHCEAGGGNEASEPQQRLLCVLQTQGSVVAAQRSPRYCCGRAREQSIRREKAEEYQRSAGGAER